MSSLPIRSEALALLALLMACTSGPCTSQPGASGSSEPVPEPVRPAEEPRGRIEEPAEPAYYTDAELAALSFRIEPPSYRPRQEMFGPDGPSPTVDGYDFLCRGEHCVCRLNLPCTAGPAPTDCVSFERNVEVFRQALDDVVCVRAETGHCGDLRYFYFEGDIHRYEMRYFNASGQLVAQRNWTDYPEYCNHTALTRWMGRVPKCDTLVRDELLCGEAPAPLLAPLGDLRSHTRDPFAGFIPHK